MLFFAGAKEGIVASGATKLGDCQREGVASGCENIVDSVAKRMSKHVSCMDDLDVDPFDCLEESGAAVPGVMADTSGGPQIEGWGMSGDDTRSFGERGSASLLHAWE